MPDTMTPDMTPEQQGGPTWGTIAIPSQMSVWNPGASVIGGLAADTAFNAKRAQNLAAFEAYQRMNPGATAADLSAAAENISGGDNFLGGALNAPSVMADIARKNQLTLQSQQAREQGDVVSGYLTAMNQAIDTATTPDEWVAKAKALMPQSSWGSFDSYMGPKNTQDMFKVYQQRRVSPIVKDGVDFMWDTLDKYVTAAGGNEALGKMAMDAAMPQVNAAKQKLADLHGKTVAEIEADKANAAQSYAAAAAATSNAKSQALQSQAAANASNADADYRHQLALNEKVKGNQVRQGFFDDILDKDLQTQQAVSSQDPAEVQAAWQRAHDAYFRQFPDATEDEFKAFWAGAPATVANKVAARNNALKLEAALQQNHTWVEAPTAGLQAQYKDKETAVNALDQATFDKLGADDKKKWAPLVVSAAQNILADKDIGITDTAAFNRIVAEDTIAGKNPDQIREHLRSTFNGMNGLPVLGDKTKLQQDINDRATPDAPMNEPELKQQLDDHTKKTLASMDTFTKKLALPAGQGGSVADLQAQFAEVQQENDRTLRELTSTLATLNDRNRQGEIWAKDPATKSYLARKIEAIQARGEELRRAWDKRGDLKIKQETMGPSIQVGTATYKLNADIRTLPAGAEQGIINTVQANVAQPPAASRYGGGAMGTPGVATGTAAATTFDPDFLPYLQANPAVAKIAAVAANELNRIDTNRTTVPTKSYQAGQFDPRAQSGAHLPPLTDMQVGQLVDQIIDANKATLPPTMSGAERDFMAKQITKLLLLRTK